MAWTFNGTRIFLQTQDETITQTIARLQPLVGKTIKQFFGYESPIIKLTAIVVGDTDKNALMTLATTQTSYNLYNDATLIGTYFLHSMSVSRNRTVSQTLRQDLDCTAPVYTVEMEIYPDDE